jgi:regulator of CtrA degradation
MSASRCGKASVMSEKSPNEAQPVSFGERLASSQVFADLFHDGMGLVEETATYLDGSGRQESKRLGRAAALAYATESMRLTTRLMQLASWLLLHRAVKEGEMSLAQASKEKSKVKLSATDNHDPHNIELLPEKLRGLIERAQALNSKVYRLDSTIHKRAVPAQAAINPVEHQLGLLKAAFGAESA